ncbi:MAG TPA: hypothetical protein VF184_06905, partial [Phycisphaeraceae bacterium]
MGVFVTDGMLRAMRDAGLLDEEAARRAQELCAQGQRLDEAVRRAAPVEEGRLLGFFADYLGVPLVDLQQHRPGREL